MIPSGLYMRILRRSSNLPLGILLLLFGTGWLILNWSQPDRFCAECVPIENLEIELEKTAERLQSGMAVSMGSPLFRYFPTERWQISESGADPGEPENPDAQPSGVVEFEFQGEELDLLIATGNFWGYLLVAVDDEPANLLPLFQESLYRSTGNSIPPGWKPTAWGYKTLYEPETQSDAEWRAAIPTSRWLRVHKTTASPDTIHTARIMLWRSWGQTPLRGVAIDRLPSEPRPLWPGLTLSLLGLTLLITHPRSNKTWEIYTEWSYTLRIVSWLRSQLGHRRLSWFKQSAWYWTIAVAGIATLALGTILPMWWLALLGVALLASTALSTMTPWMAALLFGLPFYFGVTLPLLPSRSFNLLDLGILGGIVLLLGNTLLKKKAAMSVHEPHARHHALLAFIIGWALITVVEADHFIPALREWRTVFLNSGLFAFLLFATVRGSDNPAQTRSILVSAWLLGGTVTAIIALWQLLSGINLITAEGVVRVRAFYGSPNNLALYLERTLAVSMALGLLLGLSRWRWFWLVAAGLQLAALIFTFSKGALFLGLPAMLVVIVFAVRYLLADGQSAKKFSSIYAPKRVLIWTALVGAVSLLALTPFLGTERFQQLLDFSQGTSFLRLQLWRSSWSMVGEHPLFGVGPDNFLYRYRTDFILPSAWEERDLNHPHNLLLDWLTRLGIPGITLGLSFWGVGIWRIIQRLRFNTSDGPLGPALQVGLLAAVVASLAHGLIDASYALPDLMLVWVFLLLL